MPDKTCFVVMPFGEKPGPDGKMIDFDKVYDLLIAPVAKAVGLRYTRSDKETVSGSIHKHMLRKIADSDVVIVDITTNNPNVFYELGVRHALRPSVTVLLKRQDTQIPFNIAGLKIIDYDMSFEGVTEARKQLGAFIKNGLGSGEPDSLVYDVLPDLKVAFSAKANT